MDISPILVTGGLRPTHFDDAGGIFNGQAEDDYQAADQTAGKTSLLAAIDILVEATTLSPEDQDTLKADIAALVNGEGHIQTLITILKSDVFTAAKAQFITAIEAHEEEGEVKYQYPCRRCKNEGRYAASQEPNADPDDDTLIPCASCDQLTVTEVDNIPKGVSWPAVNTF